MFDDFHVSIAAEELFKIGPLPITNSFITTLVVMALLIIGGAMIARRMEDVPGRRQGAAEFLVEYLFNLSTLAGGKKLGRQVFPLMASIFIFIFTAHVAGLLPGVGTIGTYHHEEVEYSEEASVATGQVASLDGVVVAQEGEEAEDPTITSDQGQEAAPIDEEAAGEDVLVPFVRAPNADLNMTLAMALISFTTFQVMGLRLSGGIGNRLRHMAPGPKALAPVLFPIEVITELSRLVSLTARLFGNVFAGEVVLALMYTIANGLRFFVIPFAFPIVFIGLELLFGFIQATVFALLTVIYINLAGGGHTDDDHDEVPVTNQEAPFPDTGMRPSAQVAD
ncbi:MAG: ATP synthase F0 sector subunit a [uncultured Thermomicrobiales bacterium]|uniref:ATP synthase subunit a n=1 Tax=uncultured Thermomicrobiales bacterium TaxID=1645740 RepID=A0A6J4USB6_9BACT|nr:MAG: ATP synthase F0 sector subunit a [uncultured Thermomicrobiales bacterium]